MSSFAHPSTAIAQDGAVEVQNVVRRFGDLEALAGVSVRIRHGEFFSLLGPSGCGKTTLLRIIAGLDLADEGEVRIGGMRMNGVPAHRRPVNTVFQSYALFPHLTVFDNVAFGLRMKKVAKADIQERVKRVLDVVQIANLGDRKPDQLSGGQRQRVALARALVNEPKVLLLDEPLGALDLKLRKTLQVELMTLQRRLGITFVCVTHDQEEALVMSDRIAVMKDGLIVQVGDAEALYEKPRTRFVGQFLGSVNLFDAVVKHRAGNEAWVDTPVGELHVDFGPAPGAATQRDRFTLAIRPEKVNLTEPGTGHGENRIHVRVEELIYVGSETHYMLTSNGHTLTAEAMNTKVGSQGFDIGQDAMAAMPAAGLIVLDD
jgi:spermidine/putrescine transport system ATP-binding protein